MNAKLVCKVICMLARTYKHEARLGSFLFSQKHLTAKRLKIKILVAKTERLQILLKGSKASDRFSS